MSGAKDIDLWELPRPATVVSRRLLSKPISTEEVKEILAQNAKHKNDLYRYLCGAFSPGPRFNSLRLT